MDKEIEEILDKANGLLNKTMIQTLIKSIEGEKITSIQTGVGSIIYFGNEEFFFTIYCSWRLRNNNCVLVNWHQTEMELIEINLNKLSNLRVISVIVNEMFDLSIKFENGLILDVFTDIADNNYGHSIVDNWDFVIVSDNLCYSINYMLNVKTENYL